mmetsp:Transcript_25230/g.42275  ORF Transcript_25230/g.42275 Transcript_25230/m.42275 type:complete len:189 (-) Transcript_25230:285-851(-)|eukprot:CAMPEP_0198218948 /NCGR_PEP_ID=MMETSP1445-20131203/71994_1 /TAXON_ID=36898 /ORGANISM="Pyramimonas sp., Strain CCMP2087" /LENGTH=188 /DNA_ID=CAMNT_0043896211 /DNA_START=283 /DNA_END=849 /DNA_ORIENTATION=-
MYGAYLRVLASSPVKTKIWTGFLLGCSSDLAAQARERKGWDARRTSGFAMFGAGYMGCFQHHLFARYAQLWPVTNAIGTGMMVTNVAKTLAAHQLVIYPLVYFPVFFLITGTVGLGLSLQEVRDKLRNEWWETYKIGVVVWTPAMLVQFCFVPVPLQVLYITACSFAWTTYLSNRCCSGPKKDEAHAL